MACNITKDSNGKIIKVLDSNGKESMLFNKITELPHVESLEQAVTIYEEILKANPEEKTDGFVSNALAAITNIKDKAVKNIKGWMKQLIDVQKNGGVKNVKQEFDWIGLEDYLNEWVSENKPKNGNIPLEVIEQYIKDNQIEIVEVSKQDKTTTFSNPLVLDKYYNQAREELSLMDSLNYENEEILDTWYNDPNEDNFSDVELMLESENIDLTSISNSVEKETNETIKYSEYTLEGGENYREILLTLPEAIRDKGSYIKEKKVPAKDRVIRKYNTTNEGSFIDFYTGQKKYYSYQVATENATGKVYSVINGVTKEEESKETALKKVEDALFKTIPDKTVFIPYVRGIAQATYETKEKAESLIKNLTEDEGYKSSHWDESNILAHVRMNERTLPNGERVLFIEEVQSDWAQDGKKKGFAEKQPTKNDIYSDKFFFQNVITKGEDVQEGEELIFEYKSANGTIHREMVDIEVFDDVDKIKEEESVDKELYFVPQLDWSIGRNLKEAEEYIDSIDKGNALGNQSVPNMPYKKTDQWVGMAMRRVYQMASQEGFDRVAWVTGEQSAERYNLSKQASSVEYFPEKSILRVFSTDAQSSILLDEVVPKDKIEDYVGKEVAQKLLESEAVVTGSGSKKHSIGGNDLKVGGEGMKTFYNSILPKVAKKEAQRFDKQAKVEVMTTDTPAQQRRGKMVVDVIRELENNQNKTEAETEQLKNLKIAQSGIESQNRIEFRQQLSIPITDKMKSTLGTSAIPMFSLESGGNKYESFNEALDDTNEKTIDIVSNGKVVASLPSTLDERTTEGFINSLISDGIVKPNKVVFNGKTYFQTVGETAQDRMVSEEFLKDVIRQSLDKDQYTIEKGLVEIRPKNNAVAPKGSFQRVVSDTLLNYFSGSTVIAKGEKISETNLKLNLMKILSDMGISVMSIKQYQDKFKAKSKNIPPSAEALADVVNRVIAFKDGQLTLDNLTEEVMHLIVETLPQEQVDALSELVKNSEEYQTYYEQYNEIYKGDQKLLEKEILGKILKNITLNKVGSKSESFLGRLFEILKDFFNNLTLKQSHRDQLKDLNSLVDKFVVQQEGSNFTEDDLEKSKEIALMYSLSSQVSQAQGAFQKVFGNITELRQFNSFKRELKNVSFEELKGSELGLAVGRFIEMSNKLIDTTEAALQTARSSKKSLSGQNKTILEDLDLQISSTLDSLAAELSEEVEGLGSTERVKLSEKLKENSGRIKELRALNDKTTGEHVEALTDEIVAQLGEAEGEYLRENIKKVIEGEIEDTNRIFSFFGQLHHASNPILNLIGNKIWEMNMKSNEGTKKDVSEFLNYMKDNKISQKEFETLVKDGFFRDVIDHKAFEDALLVAEMEAYSEIAEEAITTIEEYKKAKEEDGLEVFNEQKYGEYRTQLQKNQLPLIEPLMSEQYYEDLFDKYEKLEISGATQSFLKQNSADRGSIKAEATTSYVNEEGETVTRTIFSPEDADRLNSMSKIRKDRKNIFSETSTLKKGLAISEKEIKGSVELPTGQFLYLDLNDDMSEGEKDLANISFDLHKLDNEYKKKAQEEGVEGTTDQAKANFLNYMESIKGNHSSKELFKIIVANLDISLSQEFYDTLNGDSFLKGDALELLNPDKLSLVKDVKSLYAKRNALLSVYRNTSSPFEIDKMTPSDQATIRSFSEEISNGLRRLKLPENVEEGDTVGEKSPNQAYLARLAKDNIAQGTAAELKFIKDAQHADVTRINNIGDVFYKKQASLKLTKKEKALMAKYEGDTLLETQLNYAKSNLQPYYTRFAPIGYESMETRVEKGEDIISVLGDVFSDPYLNKRVDNSFEEKDNPLKNPNYRDNYDGGFMQPKQGKFVDNEFISKFGIDSKGNATKNTKLFEARRLYLEARKKGLEKMREKGANPYKVIQVSATDTEKVRKFLTKDGKKATAEDFIKDKLAYRVDDLAYGVPGDKSNRILPKYYTRDLEDQSDVSTDYMFALAQFSSRANEYAAKRNVISDIDALYDILLRSKRQSKSKDLNHAIAMADSYIDNSIYGKVENRTYEVKIPGTDFSMDLAKVSRLFTKYVSLKNLGFNIVVPVTGMISGMASKKVEEIIGEKLNRDSSRLATKEYNKLFKEGKSQALDFNDNSKLFLIGQAFGIYDISEKARNAKYNTFQRTFSKSAMSLHTMANYPIIPKIALSVMYDNRLIDGKILNRTQFFQEGIRKGVSKEELGVAWKKAEDNAMYNYMNFTKTGFSWSKDIDKLIEDKDYLENRKLFMMKNIRLQVSNIDATIPQEMRLAAQRDAVGSMILLHKGFMSIFLQNRLKNRNLNIDTGLLEEGSYRTLARLMADFFNTKGDMSKKLDNLKNSLKPPAQGASNSEWLEYELNVRNMNRIGKEIAAMGTLVILGAMVFAMASDPDNEDIYGLQMTSYLTTRLLNESSTAFTPSLFTEVSSVLENPIVPYDTAKQFADVFDLFDGEEITRGKYRGLSQRQKWITKNALGVKGVYDIYGADNIRESEKTYRLYNEENIDRSTLGLNSLLKTFYKD